MYLWFDLDDTLYDFGASSLAALRQTYTHYDLSRFFPDEESWIDCYHRHNKALWDKYNVGGITQQQLRHDRFYLPLVEGGATPETAETLTAILDPLYLDLLAETGLLVDGAIETLTALRERGHRIGILSNGFTGVQNNKIASSGLTGLIDCIVLSDEIGINKPDRRLYDHALEKAGTTAADSVMIGDNPDTDIAGAIAAGWRAILFDPDATQPSTEIRGRRIDTVTSLRQLAAMTALLQHNNKSTNRVKT